MLTNLFHWLFNEINWYPFSLLPKWAILNLKFFSINTTDNKICTLYWWPTKKRGKMEEEQLGKRRDLEDQYHHRDPNESLKEKLKRSGVTPEVIFPLSGLLGLHHQSLLRWLGPFWSRDALPKLSFLWMALVQCGHTVISSSASSLTSVFWKDPCQVYLAQVLAHKRCCYFLVMSQKECQNAEKVWDVCRVSRQDIIFDLIFT